jgi:hypothetical protein
MIILFNLNNSSNTLLLNPRSMIRNREKPALEVAVMVGKGKFKLPWLIQVFFKPSKPIYRN